MELCQGGDLLTYVRKRKHLTEQRAKYFFKQIVAGLGYIHRMNIIHKDLKLENILIDNLGRIKICDFGVSRLLKPSEIKSRQILTKHKESGTLAYMAPELLYTGTHKEWERQKKMSLADNGIDKMQYYFKEVDVWAAGVVLYSMLTGKLPFSVNKNKMLDETKTNES